jgi:hypothetical protein
MSAYERTPLAITVCLVFVVAAFALLIANFEWPTSRMVRGGHSLSERDILVYDVLPLIAAGYGIGLGAIAITRFIFPKSNIKAILYAMGASATLVALPLLALSVAISGTPVLRDLGVLAMLFAVPAAIATWAIVSWAIVSRLRPK